MYKHNHCCRAKSRSIINSECVFVALIIQHTKRMRLIIYYLWPVWPHDIFPRYLTNSMIFEKKNEHKMCFDLV